MMPSTLFLLLLLILLFVRPTSTQEDPRALSAHVMLGKLAQVGFVINLSRRSDRFEALVREGRRVGLEIVPNTPTTTAPTSKQNGVGNNASTSTTPIRLERWEAFDEIEHVGEKLLN
jgi:hypothetical protein